MRNSLLESLPIESLRVSQQLIQKIISNLEDGDIVKADAEFGIFLGKGIDDPGKREIQMFETLMNELQKQTDSDKTGKAISKFVDKGVSIDGKNLIISERKLLDLHEELSIAFGADVANGVTSSVKGIIETQWEVTKKAVDNSVKKYNRSIEQGLNKIDKRLIDTLNNSNNFFISGSYDKNLVKHVNKIVEDHVRGVSTKKNLAKTIKESISEKIPPRNDFYYKALSNDVLNKARITSQINSYVEARIRRYEIFAVLDERTSEICQMLDGKIFEVEVARKIIKQTNTFGIPGSEGEAEQFKALRPWAQFDQDRALSGKDSVYFNDAKGNRTYLPDSKFKGNKVDGFTFKGKKGTGVATEIQDLGGKNTNPPLLPPFHANCRTTTIIDDRDVMEQIAEEAGQTTTPEPKPKPTPKPRPVPKEKPKPKEEVRPKDTFPKFVPAKTREEAEEWMAENLMFIHSRQDLYSDKKVWLDYLKRFKLLDTEGIDLKTLNTFNKIFYKMKVKHNLPRFTSIGNITYGSEDIIAGFTSGPGITELNINSAYLSKIKKSNMSLGDYVKLANEDGFTVAKTVEELAYHEAMHYYDFKKAIPVDKVTDIFVEANRIGYSPSRYAKTNSTEFFAEAGVLARREGLSAFPSKRLRDELEEILP